MVRISSSKWNDDKLEEGYLSRNNPKVFDRKEMKGISLSHEFIVLGYSFRGLVGFKD